MKGADNISIKNATEELSREIQKIGEAMAKSGSGTEKAAGNDGGNVRDAEFEEGKKDDKEDNKK